MPAVCAKLALSTPPSTVAPNVLPRLRANTNDAVAAPRSDQSTLSWMMTIAAVLKKPMPKPITSEPSPAT